MKLINYDFYDLYALIVFFRADTDKISEYAKALEEIIAYIETPNSDNGVSENAVRKILQKHVNEDERGLFWIWTENVYTGNVFVEKNEDYYRVLTAVFREMLRCIGDSERLWWLCNATHNIPTVLVDQRNPKSVVKSMAKVYQKKYNERFLVEELKNM